jgi:hypothetical protein
MLPLATGRLRVKLQHLVFYGTMAAKVITYGFVILLSALVGKKNRCSLPHGDDLLLLYLKSVR